MAHYFPALSNSLPHETVSGLNSSASSGRTVLLVEDEKQIRNILATMLSRIGFRVLGAANGREALELYQKSRSEITMVVTDMGMPVMDGFQLFRELKQLDPYLPIVIVSAFGEAAITSRIPHHQIAGLLDKPYRFTQLIEVLQSVLELAA